MAALASTPGTFPPALSAAALLEPGVLAELAAAPGLRHVHVDFHTLGPSSEVSGGQAARAQILAELVAALRARGLGVSGRFTLGLDHDGPDCFEALVAWVEAQGIDGVELRLRTPEPGSAEVRELAGADRIIHRDLRAWDGAHVVVDPVQMSAQVLYRGWAWSSRVLGSWPSWWRRRPRGGRALAAYVSRRLVVGAVPWGSRPIVDRLLSLDFVPGGRGARGRTTPAAGGDGSGALALDALAVYFEAR